MKIMSIVGDRPQFIKAVLVSKEITLNVIRCITNANPIPIDVREFVDPDRLRKFGFRYRSL